MSGSQDMVFTLYGDYLRHRGLEAWTGNLIELLGIFGLSEQAVRSSLMRVSRRGWLKGTGSGRHCVRFPPPKSRALLDEGAQRFFRPRRNPRNGRWHVLTHSIPETKRLVIGAALGWPDPKAAVNRFERERGNEDEFIHWVS